MPEDPTPTPPAGGTHVEPWLDAFRTGELAAADRVRVERHLARCAECAARLAEIESLARTATRAFAAGAGLASRAEPDWGRLRAAILARTVGPAPAPRPRPSLLRFAPQAALAAMAVLVLGILAREGVRGPADLERALEGRKDVARSTLKPATPPEVEEKADVSRDAAERNGWFADLPEPRDTPPAGPPEAGATTSPAAEEAPAAAGAPLGGLEGGREFEARAKPEPTPGLNERAAAAPETARRDAAALKAQARDKEARTNEIAQEPRDEGVEADRMEVVEDGKAADDERQAPAAVADNDQRAGELGATAPGADMDELQRLDLYARKALASGDAADRTRALDFWRDSVAGRTDLEPGRKRAAAALVDSLARSVPAPR